MIRWISKELGTGAFEHVQALPGTEKIDVRDLVDKKGNDTRLIMEKVAAAIELLESGKKVVVCCDYGISRSNAIAAAVYSAREKITYNESLEKVLKTLDNPQIKLDVVHEVRAALNSKTDIPEKDITSSVTEKNLLITGGTGDLGGAVTTRLRNSGYTINAPDREQLDLLSGPICLDLLCNNNINAILHFAHPRDFGTNKSIGDALVMLKNVLDVCIINKLKLFFISDIVIFNGLNAKGFLVDENVSPACKGAYSESKLLSELMINNYITQFSLDCCIVRTSNIYGTKLNKPKFIRNFAEKALNNKPINIHKYLNDYPAMDMLHIEDFTSAIELLVNNNYSGTINIGSGELIYIKDIAEKTVSLAGSGSTINSVTIQENISNVALNSEKAQKAVGWIPENNFYNWLDETINAANSSHLETEDN